MTQLDTFLGALFIGCTVATALWGVTCVQTWTYFTTPQGTKGDSRWIQLIVVALWLFDTAHQIHTTSTVYTYCVSSFGNFEALTILPRAAWLQAFFIQLVALLVHGIYIWKIWRLSKHKWVMVAPLIVLKVAQIVSAIIDMKLVSEDYTFEDLFRTTHLWTTEINAFDFTVDVVIATLMYYLLSHNESEYERTRSMIKRIMIFTLSTNMITSLCAFIILMTAVLMPRNAIFLAFLFVKSRLYVNSLMASLNFRPYLLNGGRMTGTMDAESAVIIEPNRQSWRRSQGAQALPWKQQDPSALEMANIKHSASLDVSGHKNLNVMVHIDQHQD